jgi:hypothetical protein
MKTTHKEKSMSDQTVPETYVPEADPSPIPDPISEAPETDLTINVATRPTMLQTFVAQTAGALVVATAAPILSTAMLNKVEQYKARKAEKKAQKAAEKLEKAQQELDAAQALVEQAAEPVPETKTAKK